MIFVPRFERPEEGNKYYIRNVDGGWSGAIAGCPKGDPCTILPNCSGYSQARICEASGRGKIDLLEPTYPPEFSKYLYGKCTTGDKPKLGAIIIWTKDGGTKKEGHSGNIEAILNDNTIVTSESHYNGNAWDLNVHTTVGGKPFYKAGYTFKEFIYSPYIEMPLEGPTTAKLDTLEADIGKLTSQLQEAQKQASERLQSVCDLTSQVGVLKDTNRKLSEMINAYAAGDINKDGKIDFADLVELIKQLLEIYK